MWEAILLGDMPVYLPDVQVQDEEGSVIVGWAKWEEHHFETGEHLPDSAEPDKQNWAEKETIFFSKNEI